jgi:hypothetical protein
VHRVDLLTRLIRAPGVDACYGRPEEALGEAKGELGGARIVRIPCGPVDQYVRWEARGRRAGGVALREKAARRLGAAEGN